MKTLRTIFRKYVAILAVATLAISIPVFAGESDVIENFPDIMQRIGIQAEGEELPDLLPDPKGVTGTGDVAGSIFFDESRAIYNGTWVEFPDGFQLYIPSWWKSQPLTIDEMKEGYLFRAFDPTAAGNTPYVEMTCNANPQGYDFDSIQAVLEQNGKVIDGKYWVNGFLCLVYYSPAGDYEGLFFLHPLTNQLLFQIAVYPYSEYDDVLTMILGSLSPL